MGVTGAGEAPVTGDLMGPVSDDLKIMDNSAAPITSTTNYDLDLGVGYAPSPHRQTQVAVVIDSIDEASGDETYSCILQQSDDDFVADTDILSPTITLGVGFQDFLASVTKRYVRLSVALAGTTPSLAGKAHLIPVSGG